MRLGAGWHVLKAQGRVGFLATLALAGACTLMASPLSAQDAPSGQAVRIDSPEPTRQIAYKSVDGRDLVLNVFSPDPARFPGPRPAILFLHGGSWTGGNPSQFFDQSAHLAALGMVAISAEYRTRDAFGTGPDIALQDAGSAMRYVRAHAAKLGIDPDRLAAGGGSAGGHLAAALASVTGFDDPKDDLSVSKRPAALVLFNPVIDNGPDGYGHSRVKAYWQQFSPIHNIKPGHPPVVFILGTKDQLIPAATGERYCALVRSAGAACTLRLYEGQPHGFFNRSRSAESYAATQADMDVFLRSIGYLEAPAATGREARADSAISAELAIDAKALVPLRIDAASTQAERERRRASPATLPVGVEAVSIPGPASAPNVTLLIVDPRPGATGKPAFLFMHGGGYVRGSAASSAGRLPGIAKACDCVVVSVGYRLAPETRFPGPMEDNFAALSWLHRNAGARGIDPSRIAIGGASAGGGHAAQLAIAARDRGVPVRFQVLIYPMLDDRTGSSRPVSPHVGQHIWNAEANRFGWTAYLGRPAGAAEQPHGSVPARVADLSGLPPAWIGVGALDLFLAEDLDYARRLAEAGTPVEVMVTPGAYHAFDVLVPQARPSVTFTESWQGALRRALHSETQ